MAGGASILLFGLASVMVYHLMRNLVPGWLVCGVAAIQIAAIAWCVFFATQLAVSAALLLATPASVWSAFVSLLNPPLLAAMVLGEFGIRMILFRHESRTSLVATVFAWGQGRAVPTGRP